MDAKYSLSLHIFRRDLRLYDNTGLIEALRLSKEVIPCFIFDKRQLSHNPYKGQHSLSFMARSLQELDDSLKAKGGKLYQFYGIAEAVVARLIKTLKIKAVFLNRDYTPFSLKRDQAIQKLCHDLSVDFYSLPDLLLNEPNKIRKSNQQPYVVFTPFFNKSRQFHILSPQKNPFNHYYKKPIAFEDPEFLKKLLRKTYPKLLVKGGRKEGLHLLKQINTLSNYLIIRDFPYLSGTTHLSAHNKFGTLSIRELYYAIKIHLSEEHPLIRQLYWRDFFTHIAYQFPHVFGNAFYQKYDAIPWKFKRSYFDAWCLGKTGFPIVDAGMRELNETGYMHNRVRMIVASFLTKDLHIDWRIGERYFAQQLCDYDPAVNNGNWQWVASTGCDASPYFRIFNPWLQQQKYDPKCEYIKRWLPELADVPPKIIHHLYKLTQKFTSAYPQPMVNHTIESQKTKKLYAKFVQEMHR